MNSKKIRDLTFTLHRYLGLAVGLVLIIVGLTGSLLVFEKEIDQFFVAQKFGHITPQQVLLSPESVVNTVKAAYASRTDLKLDRLYLPEVPTAPYKVELSDSKDVWTELLVNPYTGVIMGERYWNNMWVGVTFQIHYALMVGDTGTKLVGIVAFILLILSITGFILWPGWRKLIAGFKIKWNAHPKRVNFDLHKVAGIIAAIFLALTAFTGFCWNFYDFTEPIIYAVTFTKKPQAPVSKPIFSKLPLKLTEQLKIADAALPGAAIKSIYFPKLPKDALRIRFQLPQENLESGMSSVYLNQYTGEVLRVDNSLKSPLGDRVLNSFSPLHNGTFGGLPTRILYVFVGLAPLILFITGFVMWRYRYQAKSADRNHAIEQREERRV